MRSIILAAAMFIVASAANATTTQCKDAKGRFTKCPSPPAAAAPHHPICKIGVSIACGASCIPKANKCHKPA